MKKGKTFILFSLLLISIFSFAQPPLQQLLGSAGATFKNTNYQLDWSIGELQTETYKSGQTMFTQGFQQGTYIITALSQIKDLQFAITAFPNPATDFITLKIEKPELENMQYTLTELSGRVLQTNYITNNHHQINLRGIATGAYFLNIQSENKTIKSFKIIKSN